MKRSGLFVQFFLVAVFVALVVLTFESYHAGRLRTVSRTMMRVALEDVARRVRGTSASLKSIRSMSDAAALAKVRAFAKMVGDDPSLIKDAARLEDCAKILDVDDLHVSDGKGILIAGRPSDYIGFDLASSEQSAAFLPALTNSAFALVQDVMTRGFSTGGFYDGQKVQFAGVARTDAPGVVQIGYNAARVDEAMRLADVREIARTSRVGLGGSVAIVPSRGLGAPEVGVTTVRGSDGRPMEMVEADCGEYRIRVTLPAVDSWLMGENRFEELFVADLLVFALLLLVLPGSRRAVTREVSMLRELFGGRFVVEGALGRALRNPVTVACAVAFLVATGVAWLVMSRSSMREAKAALRAAARDMRDSVGKCVDNLLFYQGDAICGRYTRPDALSTASAEALMRQYGLDEINVVDERGVVIIGHLAQVGFDMGSNPLTAEFNCLLRGEHTYSQDFRPAIEDPTGPRTKYIGVAFPPPAKGYIQIGFAERRLKTDIDYWFETAANERHIGETGFFVIADGETGRVMSSGRGTADGETADRSLASIGFDVAQVPENPDEFFVATLFGEECLCLSEMRCFHRIVSAIPLGEIRGGVSRVVILSAAVLLCVFAIVVFFMTKLTGLVASLKEYIARDRAGREKDLAVARTIQCSSLPIDFPDDAQCRIRAKMITAREVGGDFYDFHQTRTGQVFFMIADVSGKGIPAAMFMMRAKSTIRACGLEFDEIGASIVEANNRLSENNDANMFVTAWFGRLDLKTGEVEYVNAGHNPPLVRRADGSVEWIRGRRSLVLAAMSGSPYQVHRLTLRPGDTIFLYTDGVTEAMNGAGELFGEARLEASLTSGGADPIAAVQASVETFVAGAEQSDDITMLALDLKSLAR